MRILVVPALAWAACEVDAPTRPLDIQTAFAIVDAAHNGPSGFYWLPPMVSQPGTAGAFMGTLSPTVEVYRATGDPADPWELVRAFTRASGVDVDVNGQHYQVNWDTDETGGDATGNTDPIGPGSYRIAVTMSGRPLGSADIEIVENGSAFRTLSGDVIGLLDGRTIPVKFRIEYGVLDNYAFDLAYHSTRDANLEECQYNADVFLINRVADGRTNITSSPNTMDGMPSWSPDGRKIVFASDRANPAGCGPPDLYVMDLDAGTVKRLTTAGGWKPAWSPDGEWIAFQRGWPPEDVSQNIWIVPSGGGTGIQLTDAGLDPDPCEDIDPTWHPNGNQVTFSRQENYPYTCDDPSPFNGPIGNFANFSVDITNMAWIRHNGFNPAGYSDWIAPQWSPDPVPILVAQWGAPNRDLFAMGPGWLTNNPDGDDQNPSWAPNGEEVVFTSFRGGTWGIYYVPSWSAWRSAGPAQGVSPLIVEPGVLNAWAKFRPGM